MTGYFVSSVARTGFLLALSIGGAASANVEQDSITLHRVNLHPTTATNAASIMRRIDDAALRICGASSFSLSEVKRATRKNSCWQDAVSAVVHKSGSSLLAQAFARFSPSSR